MLSYLYRIVPKHQQQTSCPCHVSRLRACIVLVHKHPCIRSLPMLGWWLHELSSFI
jgi:hypothetical protein